MNSIGNGSGETFEVRFGSATVFYRLEFSARKSVGITVLPDLSVRVTAPAGTDTETVREKVRKRAAWILKQQDYFRAFQPKQPTRRFVSGETHYYLGRQYRLKVIESESAAEEVKLKGRFLYATTPDKSDRARIGRMFKDWYTVRARAYFSKKLTAIWNSTRQYELTPQVPSLRLRRMNKRWGSCIAAGDIFLNPELIKTPSLCIEYVIVHELCHVKIPHHNREFYQLLSRILPDWNKRKERLEKFLSVL